VEEELGDRRAIIGEHALELGDVAIGVAPHFGGLQSFGALIQHAHVPAPVKDGHLAAIGYAQPEAVEPGPVLLKRARPFDGVQLESAGIQALGQSGDGAAFAGRLPTFEDHDGRDSVVPAGLFQIVKPALQAGQDLLILITGELAIEVHVFKHRFIDYQYLNLGRGVWGGRWLRR
jgi:hypothetical protein